MYCVYGKSRSILLIESTDSMIIQFYNPGSAKDRYYKILRHISGFLIVNSPPRVVYNTRGRNYMRTSVNFRAFNWNDRPQIQMVGIL